LPSLIGFKLEIIGLNHLINRFVRYKSEWEREQIKATEEAGDFILQNLPSYPPQPTGSRYRRTGTLGKSLTRKAERGRGGVVGTVGSRVVYAPYVISDKKAGGRGPQTVVHKRHGWWTLQSEVKRMRKSIVNVYRAALRRVKRNS